jgi:hypothetical protein
MKPILEWYKDLPEPIRSQAIANYDPNYCNHDEEAYSLSKAFLDGFSWGGSNEGFIYWDDIDDKAEAGYYDKPQSPLEQSLSDLTKTLEEMKESIESVRKAIGNER